MQDYEQLQKELERAKAVIAIYEADKEQALIEQRNKLASKLRTEYRDFLDAQDLEMSTDLGENLRLQLDAVFKILIKAGINL